MARTLVVVSSAPGVPEGDGFFLDRKAVEGLALYAKLWGGPVRCLMPTGSRGDLLFGAGYAPDDLPCEIVCQAADTMRRRENFVDAAVVLAAGDSFHDFALVDCVEAPVIFIIENTLETRLRINRLYHGRSFQALKSAIWTIGTEWRRRRAFRRAAGLQCNGVPSYEGYRRLTDDALLYFDTRVTEAQLIDDAALQRKQDAICEGRPLRLAFSGRLDPIKGVDHLVPIAVELNRLGVPFSLDIYGDGPLRQTLTEQIAQQALGEQVTVHGSVPFDTLMPTLAAGTDLFVCCHRQGDPSCTYTETFSCGVPIVGYDNAAFKGIVALADVGRTVPLDDVAAMAKTIAALASDRTTLAAMAAAAAAFGREHSFDREFGRRIAQLRRIARVPATV